MIDLVSLLAVAASSWGGATPSCGTAHIQAGDLSAASGDPQFQQAYATTGVSGWGDPSTCTITLDLGRNPQTLWRDWCHLASHEYGHLLGQSHSIGVNIMNPSLVYTVPIPVCDPAPVARPVPVAHRTVKRHKRHHHHHHRRRHHAHS